MKLRLPHQLLHSLMACICSVATLSTTVATGTLVGGAVVLAVSSGLAQATTINSVQTDTINSETTDTDAATEGLQVGDIGIDGTADNVINVEVDASASKIDGSGSYTKKGEGTLTVTGAATGARPANVTVQEGELVIDFLSTWGGSFVTSEAQVLGGAILTLAEDNALGINDASDDIKSLILTGTAPSSTTNEETQETTMTEAQLASLQVNASVRLHTTLELKGYTSVYTGTDSTGTLVAYAANSGTSPLIRVSSTNNTISTNIQLDTGLEISVAENGSLNFSGAFSGSGALTKTGAGVLTLSGTDSSLNDLIISGGSVENSGSLTLNGVVEMGSGASFSNSGALIFGSDFSTTLTYSSSADGLITYTTGITNSGTGTVDLSALKGNWSLDADTGTLILASNDLSYNGSESGALTWSEAEGNSFGSTSFAAGDTVTFAGTTTATLGSDVFAAIVTVSEDASLALTTGSNTLSTDTFTLSGTLELTNPGTAAKLNVTNWVFGDDASVIVNWSNNSGTQNALPAGFDGAVVVKGGNLTIGSANSSITHSSVSAVQGGRLEVSGTYDGGISISGTGDATYGGALCLASGSVLNGSVTVEEGGASTRIWEGISTWKGDLILNGKLTKDAWNGTISIQGNITGGGGITVSNGKLAISPGKEATTTLQTGDISLAAGTTLEIHHAGGSLTDAAGELADLSLGGGATLHVEDMSSNDSALSGGTLTSTGSSANLVTYNWKGGVSFAVLTGDANLTIDHSGSAYTITNGGGGDNRTTTFGTLLNYNGTLSNNVNTSNYHHTLVINGANQGAEYAASVVGTSKSTAAFTKSGEGSVSFENHTAEDAFSVTAGTLTAGTLALSDSHALVLTDATIGVQTALASAATTTLGNVTLGTSVTSGESTVDYKGAITLSGVVTFTGAVQNNVALTLTGALSITEEAFAALTPTGTLTYSNTETGNGYLGGTYSLINLADGATLSFGEGVESATLALPDGTNTASLSTAGVFTSAGFGGIYYINNSAAYDATEMAAATGFTVAAGQTLTFTASDSLTDLPVSVVLGSSTQEDGTVLGSSVIINGVNIGDGDAGISGTGNVTVSGDVHVLGSSTINNAGTITVNNGTLTLDSRTKDTAALGSEVTGITVQNGTMNFGGADWDKALTLQNGTVIMAPQGSLGSNSTITLVSTTAEDGTTPSTNLISAINSTLRGSISGTGNLELSRYDDGSANVFNIAGTISHTGNLVISGGAAVTGGSIANVGNVTLSNAAVTGGSINNAGVLTLDGTNLNMSYVGSDVTAIELANATLTANGTLSKSLISTAVEGGSNIVVVTGHPFTSAISGDGDLTLRGESEVHFYSRGLADFTGNLILDSGTVNLGHWGTEYGNPIVNHSGDLVVSGATVNMGGKQGQSNESTISNGGNLIISSGSLLVGSSITNVNATPTITLAGTGNATGKIVVSGGTMSVTKGSITAKGIEVSSGTLELGTGITLTGGVTDADGNAVDAIRISGGSVTTTSLALTQDVSMSISGGSLSLTSSDALELAGGSLSIGTGYEFTNNINATAASTIYGAATPNSSTNHAGLSGTLSGTADVTINSAATTVSGSNHGNFFALAGNVNLGDNDLIISGGVVRLGAINQGTATSSSTISAGDIVVNSGATLEIFRNGGSLDTGIELAGGTLHIQQVNNAGSSNLSFESLTVSANSAITSASWGKDVTFGTFTGTGDLSVSSNRGVIIDSVGDYTGTVTVAEGGNVQINGAAISAEKTATFTGATSSRENFEMSGAGTLALGTHTAEKNFTLTAGTLTANTLALGTGASLALEGGVFGVANELNVTVDTTLGRVTLGTDGYTGAITLSGAIHFNNVVTTNTALTLAGDISLSAEALNNVELENVSYSYKGTSGYLSGTGTLVTSGTGGSVALGGTLNDDGSKTITVGSSTAKLTVAEGTATITLTGDTAGTYYVNDNMSYKDDETMATATSLYVSSGATLAFTQQDWGENLELAGGTVTFNIGSMKAGKTITLYSTSASERSQNTLSMTNSTLNSTITGTGDLVLANGGSDVFNLNSAINFTGNLTLENGVTVGTTINNVGSLTLRNQTLNYDNVGSNVEGITLAGNGVLRVGSNGLGDDITVSGTGNTVQRETSSSGFINLNAQGEGELTFSNMLAGSAWLTGTINHVGDLLLSATGGGIDLQSGAIINNEGSVTHKAGSLNLLGGSLIGSNVTGVAVNGGTVEVRNNATITLTNGSLSIAGGTADVQSGSSITAQGLSLTSGTLKLANTITLTGGVVDAESNPVDTVVLTGGTLAAVADVSLAHSATLGSVTINSDHTVQVEAGEVDGEMTYTPTTQYYGVTLGTAEATTSFVGTVTNNAALTINGSSLAVSGLGNFNSTLNERAEGTSGYSYTSYDLVSGTEGSTLTLGTTAVTLADTLTEGWQAASNATVNGGSASLLVAMEGTYHVAADSATSGIAYSTINQNANGFRFSTIALEGGKLNVAANETVTQAITLTADSNIFASARMDGKRASIEGSITGDYNLTITSDAKNVSDTAHGDFAVLAADVNLGSHDLTINGIVRLGAADDNSAANAASIVAGSIVVGQGSTLEIQRTGAALGAGEDGIATTGLTLSGSTLHLQNVVDASGTNGAGTLAFGTLTVNAAVDANGNALSSTISKGYWGGTTSFTSLAGAGDLTLSADLTTNIGELKNYTGTLTVSAGKLNFGSNLSVTGNSVQLKGGTLATSGALQIAADGSVTMSGGALSATRIELTGGELTYAGGAMNLSNTADKLSLTGGTLTAAADFTLSGNMTLGNVTLSSNTYTTTVGTGEYAEDGTTEITTTSTEAYAITLGKGGTTTFVGTVTNAGNLTLGGSLVVNDLSQLENSGTNAITYGQTGYNYGSYTLVKVENTPAMQDGDTTTVAPTLAVTADKVTISGLGDASLTVADGAATFNYAESTYHIGSDALGTAGVAYSTISGIESSAAVDFTTIALDGGVLHADGDIAEDITVTAASGITATAASNLSGKVTASGDKENRSLALDGTAAALTLSGTLISVDSLTTTGDVNLTGNVNLANGQGTITVNGGTTMFGVVGGKSTNTLGVSELIVNEGATLGISRWASSVNGEAFTTAPNLTLNGGTLHMQAMEGSSTTAGLVFGSLTVTGDSYITSEWSHTTFFNTMTGTGNLTIEKFSNANGWLWGETTYMGINSLVDYTGTLTMADSDEMKLYLLSANQGEEKSGTVIGTTYSSAAEGSFTKLGEGALALDKHVAEGSFTVAAGTLSVNALTLGTVSSTSSTDEEGNTTTSTIATSTGNVELNGGILNIGTGGIGTVTADNMDGVTSTITLAGGTLGATGEGWSTTLATTVSGDATIHTTTVGAETGATITMGDISVAEGKTLTISGVGSLAVNELNAATGALDLNRTASLVLNGSGVVGTWDLANSSATSSTIKVATGETLTINGVTNSGSEIDTSAEMGTQHWWSLLTSGRVEEGYNGTIIINSVVNTSNEDYTSGDTSHTISGNYVVNGNMHLNAWGASTYALVDENASLTVNAATRTNTDGSSTALAGNLKLWNAQTLEVKGDVSVAGLITLGKNSNGNYGNTLTISGGAVAANGITLEASAYDGHTITLASGSLTLGAEGIHASTAEKAETLGAYTINLAGGTLGATADWASDLAVTLGSAEGLTIASGADNTITLSGATTFAGAVTNTGNLVLSGVLSATADAFAGMTHGEQTYSYDGKSGFLASTYTLVTGGENATLTFGTEEVLTGDGEDAVATTQDKTSTTITVGSNTFTVNAANGGATFIGHDGVYYVNGDMARSDDADMDTATSIIVQGSTLTLDYDGSKTITLNNGTLVNVDGSLGGTITLEGEENTLSMASGTLRATVSGEGNLVLVRAADSWWERQEFFISSAVSTTGDVTLRSEKATGSVVFNSGSSLTANTLVMEGNTTLNTSDITVNAIALTSGTLTTTVDQSYGVNATLGNVALVGTPTTTEEVLDESGNVITPGGTTYTNLTIGAADTTTTFTGMVTNTDNNLTLLGSLAVGSELHGFTFTEAAGQAGTNGFRGGEFTLLTSNTAITAGQTTILVEGEEAALTNTGTSLTFSGASVAYYVANGTVVYGETMTPTTPEDGTETTPADGVAGIADAGLTHVTADDEARLYQFVLEGGVLSLKKGLEDTVAGGISVAGNGMLALSSGVTLHSADVSFASGAVMTLSGTGTYVETTPSGNVTGQRVNVASDWAGTVELSGALDNTYLNLYGNGNSTIVFNGASGYLGTGETTYASNIVFKNTDTGAALTLNNGSSGDSITFAGDVSGSGDMVRNDLGSTQNYNFLGDVAGWTGHFSVLSANGQTNLTFARDAKAVNVAINNESDQALNVTFDNTGMADAMAVNSAITGKVNVTFAGRGYTYFNGSTGEGVSATLSEGALYVTEAGSLTAIQVESGTALALVANNDRTVGTHISGSGIVGNEGAGVLTLSNLDSQFTGRLFASTGSMVVSSTLDTTALAVSGAGQLTLGAETNSIANLAMVAGSTILNEGALTLSGKITVDLASLSRLDIQDGAEYSYDNANKNGYLVGHYVLVTNGTNGKITIAEGTTLEANGNAYDLVLDEATGDAIFTSSNGTYYVNTSMAFMDDVNEDGVSNLVRAENILVTNATLDLDDDYDKASHNFVLDGATLRQDTSSLSTGTTIELIGATSTLAMANTTLQATIFGSGDLELQRIACGHCELGQDKYNNFQLDGLITNEGDITLTTAEDAEGSIIFLAGATVANGGNFIVTEGTTVKVQGANFSAADVVNSGSFYVTQDTTVKTYAIGAVPDNKSDNGKLFLSDGVKLTILDLDNYHHEDASTEGAKAEAFWTLLADGISFESGNGTVVLDATGLVYAPLNSMDSSKPLYSRGDSLNVDRYWGVADADVERYVYGNFEVLGNMVVNNGGLHQTVTISAPSSSLHVTGDAAFLSAQELRVGNGGSLTVDGTLFFGHSRSDGNYYANIIIGTTEKEMSSSVTLGGLTFQNYYDSSSVDYNYLRLGNGTLTFVDDGENKALVQTIFDEGNAVVAGSRYGEEGSEDYVVAKLELDGGPLKTATTGSGPALGWDVSAHIAVEIVGVTIDTSAGGVITFNGSTEFWGTARTVGVMTAAEDGTVPTHGLELAGTISVKDFTTLTCVEGVAPEGNGFSEARYYLVQAGQNDKGAATNATVTFGTDADGNAITQRENVVVGGLEDTVTLLASGGNAYFAETGSVYHINVGTVDYADIAQESLNVGLTSGSPTAISMDTAGVGLSLAGQTLTESTMDVNGYTVGIAVLSGTEEAVTADVRVTAAEATITGGVNSYISGPIVMSYVGETPGTLTIASAVTNEAYELIATTSYLQGEGLDSVRPSFALRGDIDLVNNNLVIDGGWVAFGEYHEDYGHSDNTLRANSLTVNSGASLEIYHEGEATKDFLQLTEGITLNGGRLFVRALEAATGGNMNMGNLTVTNGADGTASSLGWYWGGTLDFDNMTGEGDLNIMGPDGNTADAHGVTFATVSDYTGTMTISRNAQSTYATGANVAIESGSFAGNIVLEHGNVTLGGDETAVDMTGAIRISGGSMDVSATSSIADSTGVEVSGGSLTLNSASSYGVSAPTMTLSGSGLLNHKAAGDSASTLDLVMKNGGTLDLWHNTVYGNITLASAEGEAGSHIKGGGTVVGTVSGTGDFVVDYTIMADYHLYTMDASTAASMNFDGNLVINSAGEYGDGKKVWIGSEDGQYRADISGKGAVQVNYGDLTLRQGSISKTEGVEVASTGSIQMGDGGKIYATSGTQEEAAAIIGNQTSKWASFTNGTITSEGIAGFTSTNELGETVTSTATLYQATVTVNDSFALENLHVNATQFDINAALGVKSGVTMEDSVLHISTMGSVVNATADGSRLVLDNAGHTIALDAAQEAITTLGEATHAEAGLTCTVVTSTQLAGISHTSTGSFTLDLEGEDFLALLSSGRDIMIVFVDPNMPSLADDELDFSNGSLTFLPSETVGVDYDYRVDTSISDEVFYDLASGVGLTLADGMTAVYIKAAPEPTTSALSLLALAALAARRRRK